MKYTVTAWIDNNQKYETVVSIRRNAKIKTIFQRCMNEIGLTLIKANVISGTAKYKYSLPNIWANGYVGAAWFCDPFINIAIQEETGAWIAL